MSVFNRATFSDQHETFVTFRLPRSSKRGRVAEKCRTPVNDKELEMSISPKEKELAAVGISVAAGCIPCTNYHIKEVGKAGATDDEICKAIADAKCVSDSALKIMVANGLAQLGEVAGDTDCGCADTNRIKEIVSVGAAYAVNCTTNLDKHLEAARNEGISDEELNEVVELAKMIKGKAASHLEHFSEKWEPVFR